MRQRGRLGATPSRMRTTTQSLARPLIALLAGATLISACGSDTTTTTAASTQVTVRTTVGTTTVVAQSTATTDGSDATTTDGGESSSGTAVSDPCTLLTADGIAAALGIEAGQVPGGTSDDFNGAFPGCAWGEYVKVYVGLTDGWLDSDGTEALEGLGDRAFYDSQWHRVAVQSGEERFFVVLGLLASGDDLSALRPLAQDVIANLPS